MEKKNQIPKYPHLRFPEFTDEWKEVKLGEVAEIIGGGTPSTTMTNYWNGGIVWFNPSEIGKKKYVSNSNRTISHQGLSNSGARLLPKGTVLLTTRATIGEIAIANVECTTNQGFQSVITGCEANNEYVYYFLSTQKEYLLRHSSGSTFRETPSSVIRNLPLHLPSLPEQQKIAALLSLIDKRIEVQNAISNDLESLIVGFYNSVQYVTKAGWHKVRLRDLLTIRKEQNTSGSYEVYSVSVSRGIVNQIVHLGRSFAAANTSNYGVVHPGDLVYTKSPTGQFPFGIVKQNHNASPVAVSPLYGVYRPISPEVGTLLHYFFLSPLRANNYLAPLIQKGAKNTINIRTDHFLDNVVLLPKDEKELRCIADCLLALDERLSVERECAEQLKLQKTYLLRQMFI